MTDPRALSVRSVKTNFFVIPPVHYLRNKHRTWLSIKLRDFLVELSEGPSCEGDVSSPMCMCLSVAPHFFPCLVVPTEMLYLQCGVVLGRACLVVEEEEISSL